MASFSARDASLVTTMPASPAAPRFFDGKNEKQPYATMVPERLLSYSAPSDCAASSMTTTVLASATSITRPMSAECPYRWTGMIALVREVILAAIWLAAMLYVTGSMSTKTGVAPRRVMAPTVAKKVYGVVMTSSPGP